MHCHQAADAIPGMQSIIPSNQFSFVNLLERVRERLNANSIQEASPRAPDLAGELNFGRHVSKTEDLPSLDDSRSFQTNRRNSLQENRDPSTPVTARAPSDVRPRSRTIARAPKNAPFKVIPCLEVSMRRETLGLAIAVRVHFG